MARKNYTDNKSAQEKAIDREPPLFYISLRIGAWRGLFKDEVNKLIIAKALNHCAHNDFFTIAGYLITSRRVFLVIYAEGADAQDLLLLFYDSARKAIKQYLEWIKISDGWLLEDMGHIRTDDLLKHLFYRQHFVDDYLFRLLINRPVKLKYYSPHLAILKDRVRNADFCSVIDYSGGQGPVEVTRLLTILN